MSDRSRQRIEIAEAIRKYLVCPKSRHALVVREETVSCPVCNFEGRLEHGIVVMLDANKGSFFDDKVEILRQGILDHGANWRIACQQQVALLESHFSPGQIILDVGCGPHLPYRHLPETFIIGLEPSLPSIRENQQVDLGVCGTATNIPLPDRSVDIAVAFYSVHHMVGTTTRENDGIVENAFAELGRVVKPGGSLFVFEMTPWRAFATLQRLFWNPVRRLLGDKLDMFFRSAESMSALGRAAFPAATLEVINFESSPFEVFPPVFSLPWLRIPKLMYPLKARGYKWRSPAEEDTRAAKP